MAKNSLTLYKREEQRGQQETQRRIFDSLLFFFFVFLCVCVCLRVCMRMSICVCFVSFVPFLSGSFWEEMMRWFLYFANKHSIHLLQCKRNKYAYTFFLSSYFFLGCALASRLFISQMNTQFVHISCAKSCSIMLHAPLFHPCSSFIWMWSKRKKIWKETHLKCELISKSHSNNFFYEKNK